MKTGLKHSYSIVFLVLVLSFLNACAQDRSVIVHDPVMIKEGNTYYIFHTGRGILVKSSTDMRSWKEESQVFSESPAWVLRTIPRFRGSMWAPDIFYHNGVYYLYYSVSAFGRNTSAIGVATNTTLNPKDPKFKWVDQGKVVESVPGRDMWNAIDPNIIVDEQGTPWMVFGSFWMGMKMVKLNGDMKSIVNDSTQEWYTVAARERNWKVDERDAGDAANPELDYESLYTPEQWQANKNMKNGAVEAPFLFRKNGYYYLFVSWDRCCRGLESSYKIAVGRSKEIRGPYVDKSGMKMIHGGGTLIASGNEEFAAVGHQAVYTFDGKDYLVFHAYDKKDDGKPKLRIKEIKWDANGWPSIDW